MTLQDRLRSSSTYYRSERMLHGSLGVDLLAAADRIDELEAALGDLLTISAFVRHFANCDCKVCRAHAVREASS